MLTRKEEKVASTVHLYRRQLFEIDELAERTGHSRARVLREIVDAGLATVSGEEAENQRSLPDRRNVALDRLLRMSDGYGESSGSGMDALDEELYGDA